MTIVYNEKSPYINTPQTYSYVQYLDIWQPPSLKSSSDDQYIILDQKYTNRPDLLSNDCYGSPRLWWVFSVYNPDVIIDPIFDMAPGITILIPSQSSLSGLV